MRATAGSQQGLDLHIPRSYKFISNAGYRKDELRMLGVGLKLISQAGDVHVDGTRQSIGVISPHGPQNFDARNGSASPFDEVAQELKFTRRQVNGIAIARDFVTAHVDLNAAELMYAVARPDRHTSQQDLYARDKFRSLEGLGDVVVPSKTEADDFVSRLVPSA